MKNNDNLAIGVIHPDAFESNIISEIIGVILNEKLNITDGKETMMSENMIDDYFAPVGHVDEYLNLKNSFLTKPVYVVLIKGKNVFEQLTNVLIKNPSFSEIFYYSTCNEETKRHLDLFFPCNNRSTRTKRPTKKQ